MKKKLILLALCLFALTYSQTAQAQTKEETIAWIKEKLEKYVYTYTKEVEGIWDIHISPCRISYTYSEYDIYHTQYRNAYNLYQVSFPLTSITSIEEGLGSVDINFDAGVVLKKIYVKGGNLKDYTYWKTENYIGLSFIKNAESDLVKRMEKALLHLATFCEKKKETF